MGLCVAAAVCDRYKKSNPPAYLSFFSCARNQLFIAERKNEIEIFFQTFALSQIP